MIKCCCKNESCRKELYIATDPALAFFTITNCTGVEDQIFYVDANTLVQLIGELKKTLLELANRIS